MDDAIKKNGETNKSTEDLDIITNRNCEKLKHECYGRINA